MIYQIEPVIGTQEAKAISAYLQSGGWLTEHKKAREFESVIAHRVGADYCVVMNNATAALYAGLLALGIGSGDEVIVPDYTFIASATAVSWTGAVPVLVDVSASNLCLDLDLAESAITPRTKAIMVVSLNGRSPDMHMAHEFARRHGLFLVEDAAQSLGSVYANRHLGTFGHFGVYSFSSIKVITTGQGGALVTPDSTIVESVNRLKNFGRSQPGANQHRSIGYNFKFTDLQAVIGLEQIKSLAWRLERKKEIYLLYYHLLADIEEMEFVGEPLGGTIPWLVDVLVSDPETLRRYLLDKEIMTRRMYPAIHTTLAYRQEGRFPFSEHAAEHGLWLPCTPNLEDGIIEMICDVVRNFYG